MSDDRPIEASCALLFNVGLMIVAVAMSHLHGEGLGWFDALASVVAASNLWIYGYRVWRARQWRRRVEELP
jgi:hypothetical protein